MEPPPHKLGYPTGSSKPPPLVLKSANLVNGLNNNSVHPVYATKDRPLAFEDFNSPPSSVDDGSDLQYADFLDIPEALFALQLTRMDCVSGHH